MVKKVIGWSIKLSPEFILSDSVLVVTIGRLVFDFPFAFAFQSMLSHDARHSRSAANHVLLE